ncbi:uncharacterized protein HKW66_Vig0045350 [Vigna angularis]|uniref:Uncharacterized protein n=1 Tax=Phaseolus angularis TaxID=3914 RepID=A0A8T0KY40_PHAAN|nr:uncharacterized protein HKW66_Vig0045350 [Vigna angularis]
MMQPSANIKDSLHIVINFCMKNLNFVGSEMDDESIVHLVYHAYNLTKLYSSRWKACQPRSKSFDAKRRFALQDNYCDVLEETIINAL